MPILARQEQNGHIVGPVFNISRTQIASRRVASDDENGWTRVNSNQQQAADPRGDLAVKITLQLRLYGVHEIVIDDCTDQRLVDVRWAVLQAGRALGARPTVTLSNPAGQPPTSVTVTITSAEHADPSCTKARAGLDKLLRAVLEEQPTTCAPRRAIPRQTIPCHPAATAVG